MISVQMIVLILFTKEFLPQLKTLKLLAILMSTDHLMVPQTINLIFSPMTRKTTQMVMLLL